MVLSAICYRAPLRGSLLDGLSGADIDRLLDRFRHLNRLNGVTGAILLHGDQVVVWLEGEASGLTDSRSSIVDDLRLGGTGPLCSGPLAARLFPHCWLCLADSRVEVPAGVAELLEQPAPVSLDQARKAMLCVAERLDGCRYTRAAMLV